MFCNVFYNENKGNNSKLTLNYIYHVFPMVDYKLWNKIIYNLLNCTQISYMKITTKYSRVYQAEMIFYDWI